MLRGRDREVYGILKINIHGTEFLCDLGDDGFLLCFVQEHVHAPETRGLCLSEEQTITTVSELLQTWRVCASEILCSYLLLWLESKTWHPIIFIKIDVCKLITTII